MEDNGIEELLRIYVKFNAEAEQKPELMEEARAWFVKIEQNDERNILGNSFWESVGFANRNDVVYRNKCIHEIVRIDT